MLERNEFFGIYEDKLNLTELSKNTYSMPVKTEDVLRIWKPMYSPEHSGEFAPAVDIAVEDPRIKETEVLSPCDGVVVCGILTNTNWGEGPEYKNLLNWVQIKTADNEFFELAHITPIERRVLRVGDRVQKGQVIAIAGLNGRMTKTDGKVDSHIHMFVYRYAYGSPKGLRINWEI
jgi:murein DD-endopeptidase MepM/ murein hydrolase activator NlpD